VPIVKSEYTYSLTRKNGNSFVVGVGETRVPEYLMPQLLEAAERRNKKIEIIPAVPEVEDDDAPREVDSIVVSAGDVVEPFGSVTTGDVTSKTSKAGGK
jgi:hypothetical protein